MPRAHFSTTITREDGLYVARCVELELDGEGATPEEAKASLERALLEHFRDVEAMAPPARSELPSIDLEVVKATPSSRRSP
jgi:predicted RNase H-like HicB family nuclease